jgi:ATP-dependent Clp protease ATP-binding subunit ClpB
MQESFLSHTASTPFPVRIVDIKVIDLVERLKQQRIDLEILDAAKKYLGDAGYSETYGARPLQRVIQNEVETRIAKLIVAGEVLEGSKVVVDADERGIIIR